MAASIHGVCHGQPARWASQKPVNGWISTAGVVNHQSARTTSRDTAAITGTERVRLAKKK